MEAGRAGEPAAYSLSDSLKRLGFELGAKNWHSSKAKQAID